MESTRFDKFRILTIALIFSGALNVGLVLTLAFTALDGPSAPVAAAKWGGEEPAALANRQVLTDLLKLSFSELVACLTNREPMEEGYAKRDLALSALAASHDFHLEKALGTPVQKRLIALTPEQTIALYPGLSNEQYEAIIRYAYQEKWPLTSKGLFRILAKRPKNLREESLCEAFFATPEFYALKVLFQKTEAAQDPHTLLDLAMDGSWDVLERFAQEQAKALDLSVDRRRSLLLTYLSNKSRTAAKLLLQTDFLFAKTRLVDAAVSQILECLLEKSDLAERFCLDLLRSPRADAIWQAAAEKLYSFQGEKAPKPLDLEAAIVRFSSSTTAVSSSPVATIQSAEDAPAFVSKSLSSSKMKGREHIVQEGESLWKISRQYKVKVEDLVQHNGLEKDRLLPGMVLMIPAQGTGSEPPR